MYLIPYFIGIAIGAALMVAFGLDTPSDAARMAATLMLGAAGGAFIRRDRT